MMMLILSAAAPELAGMELNVWQICMRLLCAMAVGLVIGTEREYTHRPAGMRTHILVALGACAVMIIGQMIFVQYKPLGGAPDPARLAAQVISGVGFLGAGMIVLKNNNMITGLTTAAGVWATATVGIAVGYGFWYGALIVVVLFLVALILFVKFERRKKNTEVLYLEVEDMSKLNALIDIIRDMIDKDPVFRVLEPKSGFKGHIGLELVIDRRQCPPIQDFLELESVVFVVEI
jgi:putative Mg2+ transporter-C (MgtC) family protein